MAALTLSSGCVMGGAGDACAGWKPVRLDAATIDAMTDRDAADVLAHNEFGAKVCGW